jgi:hypothetical protein
MVCLCSVHTYGGIHEVLTLAIGSVVGSAERQMTKQCGFRGNCIAPTSQGVRISSSREIAFGTSYPNKYLRVPPSPAKSDLGI